VLAHRSGDGEVDYYSSVTRDLRERRAFEAQLVHQALHDALTDLPNRVLFADRLAQALSRAGRFAGSLAVLLLDLDHFKGVNDRHGHLTGDAVLRAAAERIASITRSSDCLARWGGEEFAILAPGMDQEAATLLAERARTALADHPVEIEGTAIELTLSVGVAVAGPGAQTPDRLLDAADEALYEAKRAGRNCVRVFRGTGAVDVPSGVEA
jgi:diguanylate cyclase (GGDEF)-like protein